MGKLKGKMGTTIMGAAIIDDIVGIIVLTTITSMQDTSVNPTIVLVKIVMFFIFVVLTGGVVFFLCLWLGLIQIWTSLKRVV